MIRPATTADIPAILGMVENLRTATAQPQALDRSHAAGFLAALIGSGLVLVVDRGGPCGFLAASVGQTSINPERVAVEHGWWCEAPGWGLRLLRRLEAWAAEQGCTVVRMSTAPGSLDRLMERTGYRAAEVAWVKRF